VEICTIGFTQRDAADFFGSLEAGRVERVVDVRLNNRSQLAGFTKASDLPFLLSRVSGISYVYEPLLAPRREYLKAYRDSEMAWDEYATLYINDLEARAIERRLRAADYNQRSALLCSEHEPTRCHRRLAAEYLATHWVAAEIIHL
jgi:uncharacterized protein (DUF488 family)